MRAENAVLTNKNFAFFYVINTLHAPEALILKLD